MTKPNDAAVLAWIEAELHEDAREPGWMTIREIMYATGRNYNEVTSKLEYGIGQGVVRKKMARVQTQHGKRVVAVYNVQESANGKAAAAADGRGRRGRGNAAKAPRTLPGVRTDSAAADPGR